MIDISSMRWKYLRESEKHSFSSERNTLLSEYLNFMFQKNKFVYDKPIPADIVRKRDPSAEIRKFRPDARCEELSLIVEFDGLPHYQDPTIVLSDSSKDIYLMSLGYTVVRIPYWLQLTRPVIFYLFSAFLDHLTIGDDAMCTLTCSFHDEDSDSFKLSIGVGAMCAPGLHRFLVEVQNLPMDIQLDVYSDIYWCCQKAVSQDIPISYVAPPHAIYEWGICKTLLPLYNDTIDFDEVDFREHLIFGEDFADTSYADNGLRMFSVDYHTYQHMIEHELLHTDSRTDPLLYETITQFIEALATSDYLFDIAGVALSPMRSDYDIYLTGLNIYTFNNSDPILSRIDHLKDVLKPFVDSGGINIEIGSAPAGNIHIAIFFG